MFSTLATSLSYTFTLTSAFVEETSKASQAPQLNYTDQTWQRVQNVESHLLAISI